MTAYIPTYPTSPVIPTVINYLERNWRVVPIPTRGKAPTIKNWTKLEITAANAPEYFNAAQQNIGVLLGEPSHGLTDVDLDAKELWPIAHRFLPKTATFGRASAPGSHWIYQCPRIEYHKFSDPDADNEERACLLEIRTKGQQTVFPPSIHPSGEKIAWTDPSAEIAEVDAERLLAGCRKLAAVALLARRWKKGQRHDLALAIAGGLLRSELWDEDEIEELISTVSEVAGDDEVGDRLTAIKTTKDQIDRGRKAVGWPKLAKLLGEKVVKCLREWLTPGETDKKPKARGRETRAQSVVRILSEVAEFFHNSDGECFARVAVGTHHENHPIRSSDFRRLTASLCWNEEGFVPSAQALSEAVNIFEAEARMSLKRQTAVRIGGDCDAIWLDLGGPTWEGVRITADGWSIQPLPEEPAFVRPKGMGELPRPVRGGSIKPMLQLLNLTKGQEILILGWAVGVFNPEGAKPGLNYKGEQGTAKSTAGRITRKWIDPHSVLDRTLPRDERELLIAAKNNAILAFDNLSYLSDKLSDAFCRLATGGGFGTRELYSDADELLISVRRPVISNGISDFIGRQDLIDRTISIELRPIASTARRLESEIWKEFREHHPAFLGALLDGVVHALRVGPGLKVDRLPRMADFALFAAASMGAFGYRPEDFLLAFELNQMELVRTSLEAEPLAKAVRSLAEDIPRWESTAADLLKALAAKADPADTIGGDWPKNESAMSRRLKRLAPGLRKLGISIDFSRSKVGSKIVVTRG